MRVLLIFLIIGVLTIPLLGCSEEKQNPEDLKAELIKASNSIKTYKFSLEAKMALNESIGEEENIITSGSGEISIKERKMKMITTTSLGSKDNMNNQTLTQMDIYMIGNTIYTKVKMGIFGYQWTKMDVEEDYWDTQDQLNQQIELLEVSEVKLIGGEKINNIDCYLIEVSPDLEKLWEVINSGSVQDFISMEIII